jgi:hypothetical protein
MYFRALQIKQNAAESSNSIANWLIKIAMAIALILFTATPAKALSAPSITPATGSFTTEQTVSMTASSGTIYYTLDGTVPDNTSTQFVSDFAVDFPTQINAVAYSAGVYSPVTTVYLDVDPNLAPVLQTGLTIRLRAGFGVTSSGSPSYISKWADLSGNGIDLTGTSGSEPTFAAQALNLLPAAKFNGSQFLSFPSETFDFSTGFSMFVVLQPTALTANAHMIDFGDAGSGNNLEFQISSSGSLGEFQTYSGTSGTAAQSASALNANQSQLLEAVQSGTSATFYVNGVPGTTNTSMNSIPATSRTANFLGQASSGGNGFTGRIAEILLYSTALSDSQREAIEAFLMQKYQALSVVPEAPIISVPTGTLAQPAQVQIASEPGTTTYITTDGTTPSTSSQLYDGSPIGILYSQTLKAISFKNGVLSSVSSATYTLDSGLWPAPSATDPATPAINLQLPAPGI